MLHFLFLCSVKRSCMTISVKKMVKNFYIANYSRKLMHKFRRNWWCHSVFSCLEPYPQYDLKNFFALCRHCWFCWFLKEDENHSGKWLLLLFRKNCYDLFDAQDKHQSGKLTGFWDLLWFTLCEFYLLPEWIPDCKIDWLSNFVWFILFLFVLCIGWIPVCKIDWFSN